MERCEKLTPLAAGDSRSVAVKLVGVARRYNECAANHDALVDYVESL